MQQMSKVTAMIANIQPNNDSSVARMSESTCTIVTDIQKVNITIVVG